jgi:hypothetical protein
MAEVLERAARNVGGFNVNSTTGGFRPPESPHLSGRGADINRVGGVHVTDPRTKAQIEALIADFSSHPEVNQIIGPGFGWDIVNGKMEPITNRKLLYDHRHHIHVGVRGR